MTAKTDRPHIGELPPAYCFFLNPYRDARFVAACPECGKKPRQRKLPLAIHVENWGTVVLNKTCRFCPSCELLIAHEDELRQLIDQMLGMTQPDAIGRPFLVVGTVERDAWRRGAKAPSTTEEMLAALHDFKDYANYQLVGGWVPNETDAVRARPK